jgi:putative DNA primase/helicase
MAESLVKSLTGGDTISARRMRENFYEFQPTHKLFLAANHKPEIRGTDPAIWSRIKLVPFAVTFTADAKDAHPPHVLEMDTDLGGKLKAEAPGILHIMVAACIRWQREGLKEPEKVLVAIGRYRAENDSTSDFIRERCDVAPDHLRDKVREKASRLWEAYESWTNSAGVDGLTKRKFGEELERRGFTWEDSNSVRWRLGIRLKC